MNETEENIIAQIDVINDMLNVICKELNEYKNIDDYEIELNEIEYQYCADKRPQKHYKILVTCKRSLEKEGE